MSSLSTMLTAPVFASEINQEYGATKSNDAI